jgi:hypothetical protein
MRVERLVVARSSQSEKLLFGEEWRKVLEGHTVAYL